MRLDHMTSERAQTGAHNDNLAIFFWPIVLVAYASRIQPIIPSMNTIKPHKYPLCQTDFHQGNSYVLEFLSCGRGWLTAKSYCNQPEMLVCGMSISTTPHWRTLTLYIRKPPKIAVSLVYCLEFITVINWFLVSSNFVDINYHQRFDNSAVYSLPQGTSTYNTTIIR